MVFLKLPITCPLVRETLPLAPMIRLFEEVVTLPLASVNIPFTVTFPPSETPAELLIFKPPYVSALTVCAELA